MDNIKETIITNNLNLIQASVLFELDKKRSRTVAIEELTSDAKTHEILKHNLNYLADLGIVEKRWEKYRVII